MDGNGVPDAAKEFRTFCLEALVRLDQVHPPPEDYAMKKATTVTTAVLLSFGLIAGCASYEPPVLRDPRTGQAVDCDIPATRGTTVTWEMSRDCVRAHRAAGMECVTRTCDLRK
jgi:hypothetical protein